MFSSFIRHRFKDACTHDCFYSDKHIFVFVLPMQYKKAKAKSAWFYLFFSLFMIQSNYIVYSETSQVLLAGVSGGFPGGTLVSPHLPIGSSRYE